MNSKSVTTVSTTGEAWGSAYNSYNGYTYVTADYEGTGVTVLNGTSIVTTISLTNFGTGLSLEQSIWYDQYYNAIIVQLDAAHYAIINGSTNSVSYMAVGNGNNADGNGNDGFGGTYSPITHLLYTIDIVNNITKFIAINPSTLQYQINETFSFPTTSSLLAFNPINHNIYVASGSTMYIMNEVTGAEIGNFSISAISPHFEMGMIDVNGYNYIVGNNSYIAEYNSTGQLIAMSSNTSTAYLMGITYDNSNNLIYIDGMGRYCRYTKVTYFSSCYFIHYIHS